MLLALDAALAGKFGADNNGLKMLSVTIEGEVFAGHAGENETSMMYFIRPDLVDTGAMGLESGLDQRRLGAMPHAFAGINWYSRYPNHFAGDVLQANSELGELLVRKDADQLARLIRYLKENNTLVDLHREFFDRVEDPLKK